MKENMTGNSASTPPVPAKSGDTAGKVAIVILILLVLGLSIGLLKRHNLALEQKQQDEARILQLSNEWTQTSAKLTAQIEVSSSLTNAIQTKVSELEKTVTLLEAVRSDLQKTQNEAESAAKVAAEEIAKRESRITALENQNSALDKQAGDLRTSITGLEGLILQTQKKLDASEGDRELLLKELKRLQAEKAELERQFNDIAILKEQLRKLKEELAISRRLEWIRKGLYGDRKGAEKLQQGFSQRAPAPGTNYNLNVEFRQDGPATVVPPSTNAPANPPK
jgi:chromosome segregation ATPase